MEARKWLTSRVDLDEEDPGNEFVLSHNTLKAKSKITCPES